uniref:Vomeronasal type-1 receptor n=1 Tax=Ornithorhynchus anatinus TaxID=9258 RepID=A0A6I8PA66_ORNAN
MSNSWNVLGSSSVRILHPWHRQASLGLGFRPPDSLSWVLPLRQTTRHLVLLPVVVNQPSYSVNILWIQSRIPTVRSLTRDELCEYNWNKCGICVGLQFDISSNNYKHRHCPICLSPPQSLVSCWAHSKCSTNTTVIIMIDITLSYLSFFVSYVCVSLCVSVCMRACLCILPLHLLTLPIPQTRFLWMKSPDIPLCESQRMDASELSYGVLLLLQIIIGIWRNIFLLLVYVHVVYTSHKTYPLDLILAQLALANTIVLLSFGIPETMSAWGLRNFLDATGCKILFYLYQGGWVIVICTTCLLSIFQAATISPHNSPWAGAKAKLPRSILPSWKGTI